MLGSAMFRFFSEKNIHDVWGTVRSKDSLVFFKTEYHSNIIDNIDVLNQHVLASLLEKIKPDYVINCVGLVKQLAEADDPLITLPINSLLPHQLAKLCALNGSKFLQISTDCVFSGKKGNYSEEDISDATDLYGKSKFIGEVNFPNTLTIRTSIIGHELQSQHSLIDWFLAQKNQCMGYSKAIFSGFPTIVLAEIIHDYVISNPALSGIYHIAASPISKFDLLNLVAETYSKSIEIIKNEKVTVDRSLNADKFKRATGYQPPTWPALINKMHTYYINLRSQNV